MNYAQGSTKFFDRGSRVVVENPKNKYVGERGHVIDLNRGNVKVRLDDNTIICCRMSALRAPTGLEVIADAEGS